MTQVNRKILIIPTWYPSRANPVSGIFIQSQAVALAREYNVAVLVPELVGWRHVLAGKLPRQPKFEQYAGLPIYRERAFAWIPRARSRSYTSYLRAARRGLERVLSIWGRPDLIHAHVVLPAGWAATQLRKHYPIPLVLTEHSSPFAMHLQTVFHRRLVQETLAQVDRLITVSPDLAQQIREFQPIVKTIDIGEIINTDFFTPSGIDELPSSTSRTRFLMVALLSKQKGLTCLLEAIRLLVQRGLTPFEVIVGGDGPERHSVESAARVLGLADRLRFLGQLSPTEVRHWMQRCDVFVLPSLHETFGVVLGEAMACGKPVIATRCGGPEWIVTPDTGRLIDKADPTALAGAMADFIEGRAVYNPATIRQRIVERFGEQAFLRQVSAVYEEIWAQRA